jgi:hypothetical protein
LSGRAGFTLPDFYQNAGRRPKVFSADLWVPTLPYPVPWIISKIIKQFGKDTEYHGAGPMPPSGRADVLKGLKLFGRGYSASPGATDMMTVFGSQIRLLRK